MKLAVTGHRPSKLGGYSDAVFQQLVAFAGAMIKAYAPNEVITGMALGWDQAVAAACMMMHVPFTAALPCTGQERTWPYESQIRWGQLVKHASNVVLVTNAPYAPRLMQVRNAWMVDNCDILVALWDGSSGGTANCVAYAQSKNKPIKQVWDSWIKFQQKGR